MTRDLWERLGRVYGVEPDEESVGAAVADRLGVEGVANRIEVVHMVSTIVGNRKYMLPKGRIKKATRSSAT
jgi:hypothetical protein